MYAFHCSLYGKLSTNLNLEVLGNNTKQIEDSHHNLKVTTAQVSSFIILELISSNFYFTLQTFYYTVVSGQQ